MIVPDLLPRLVQPTFYMWLLITCPSKNVGVSDPDLKLGYTYQGRMTMPRLQYQKDVLS